MNNLMKNLVHFSVVIVLSVLVSTTVLKYAEEQYTTHPRLVIVTLLIQLVSPTIIARIIGNEKARINVAWTLVLTFIVILVSDISITAYSSVSSVKNTTIFVLVGGIVLYIVRALRNKMEMK